MGEGFGAPTFLLPSPPLLVLRVSRTSCSGVCGLGVSWLSQGGPMEGDGSLAKEDQAAAPGAERWLLRALTLTRSPWDAPCPQKMGVRS